MADLALLSAGARARSTSSALFTPYIQAQSFTFLILFHFFMFIGRLWFYGLSIILFAYLAFVYLLLDKSKSLKYLPAISCIHVVGS